jgi:hypothetical protein
MSRKIMVVGVISAVGIAAMYWVNPQAHPQTNRELSSVQFSTPKSAVVGIVKAESSYSKTPTPSVAGIPTAEAEIASKPLAKVPAPYAPELKQYLAIKDKVFMTEQEKILRKSFLNNAQMLMALGDYLQTPAAPSADSEDARNIATDLLLEALQGDQKAVAEAALEKIITDTNVENPKLEQSVRQSMAGTKAEVLYNWSAIDPTRAAQMQTWLPGPVSAKIWQNVLQAQNQNQSEK